MSPTATISLDNLTAEAGDTNVSPRREEADAFDAAQDGRPESSLPPADRGKDAWLFLAACCILEALVWGFPFSFGVFQEYYSSHEPFEGSSAIAVIGTCSSGIMYLSGLPILILNRMHPRLGRWSPFAGLLTSCLALALGSFSTTVPHLIVTQGILYAIGGSIAYIPCIIFIDEWFVKREGLAFGIMWSCTGLGAIQALLLEHLLDTYGHKATLRIWAVVLLAATAPVAYFIKPRLPPPPHPGAPGLGFALGRAFVLYQLGNVAESAGYFLPGVFLPSYAAGVLGAGPLAAAMTLVVFNLASVGGCVGMGALADRLHATTCILVSTAGAAAGVFVLWGLAADLPVLYAFCVVYGVFAGSFTTTWAGVMRDVAGDGIGRDAVAGGALGHGGGGGGVDHTMVFVLLAAGRGVGNVLSGPLSTLLMRGSPWRDHAAAGYGSGYGSLIVFTGVTALAGGVAFVGRRLKWL